MKAGELATYLKQFAPETEVYVLYDECFACPVRFRPISELEADAWSDDGVRTGDLIMKVG